MTDYNDGKWHGWNGGECPVHPESEVEGMYLRDGKPAPESPLTDCAAHFDWEMEAANVLIAFRVIKAYREPREFWVKVYPDGPKIVHHGAAGAFKVREVLE